ncbi:MAG: methyl-accepting chemotaxis protein [Desulfurispora sp.]|uniref:methyl-accepting chemotaxis protein n=1 Tax=Desulfurispora sp. TaxID=3014275 RepID=UPI00404A6DEB
MFKLFARQRKPLAGSETAAVTETGALAGWDPAPLAPAGREAGPVVAGSEGENIIEKMHNECALDTLVRVMPLVKELFPLDCMLAVTDREKIIFYSPGQEIDSNTPAGTLLKPGDGLYEAVHQGRRSVVDVPAEVRGMPFKAVTVPIYDADGRTVLGCIGLGLSTANRVKLLEQSDVVARLTEQVADTISELAAAAENLARQQERLKAAGDEIQERVKQTDRILHFISEVANTSNLLGLNASIEAARAGEHGRGFAVVAEEIRKMSLSSADSVKEIRGILQAVNDNLENILHGITETSAIGEQQAASTQEISASVQELAALARQIRELTAQVIG